MSDEVKPAKEVLTPRDVAELLQVSEKTVRRLAIPKARLGTTTIRYLREDVLAFVRRKAHLQEVA